MVVETIKIIILGSNGFLATKITNTLDIIPITKQQLDITKNLNLIKSINPDIIIHPAGITNVDKCELNKPLAKKTNIKATKNLTDLCKKLNIKLIYFSTDFIFNGKKGDYKETDKPDPINYYGYTKLKAENIVKTLKNHLILRVAILYGHNGNNSERSFTNWLYNQLKKDKKIKIVDDQIGTPTLIDDIAKAIPKLINKTGTYHLAGSQKLSRYERSLC